jgi:hypothetical protein
MAVRSFTQDGKIKPSEFDANAPCEANDVKGKVQELASSVVLKVEETATDVTNKAQEWAGNVANKAQETASAAVDKTNDGIAAVGHQMNALSGSVRNAVPHNGTLGSAATALADELKAGGNYLEGHGLEAIGKDLTEVVRHHPVPSLLVGFGIGCLVGMAFFPRRS